ncbi:MAG TPA: diguanylate cyclase [Xanthomonadaceae bacterium]|nr:diguanylate cyclase [Xanthomonadaceae bacterium]
MERQRRELPRLVYRLRLLGMVLGGIAIAAVLVEQGASWPVWAWLAFTMLAWPHLALIVATRSTDPFRAELRNLLFDSVIVGTWVPLMHFNLLPCALLVTLSTVDKISSGVPRLWLQSLPGLGAGLLVTGLATGFVFEPETSMTVLLACLPVILIHTIAVSLASYRLIRQVTRQNHLLDQLRRTDTLTGLCGRGYWREQATDALARYRVDGEPAALVLIDVDHFKGINDGHGHGVGDEVLRALASAIRRNIRPDDCAGRLGGDEFAVLLPGAGQDDASRTAARIREAVASLSIYEQPSVKPTISVGVASVAAHADLQAWLDAADRALYRAKRDGRNQVSIAAMTEPAPA